MFQTGDSPEQLPAPYIFTSNNKHLPINMKQVFAI